MEPRYYAGEVVYAIPRTIVRAGDFVVVVTGTDDDRRAVVKQFVRSDDEHVTLHQFNPDRDIKVPVAEIEQIDLVAGTSRK
jgi:phage repressor protein C with HTH and peptisase S24 domain